MITTKRIIGLIGVIGSGKSYLSMYLTIADPSSVCVAFADEVRKATWDVLGLSDEESYTEFKERYYTKGGLRLTGRDWLIKIANDYKRISEDWWICLLLDKINRLPNDTIIISDVRMANEVKALLNYTSDISFTYCNYKSDRYNPSLDDESERLAQSLLHLPHLYIIDKEQLVNVINQ
jgi:hypothetical protein